MNVSKQTKFKLQCYMHFNARVQRYLFFYSEARAKARCLRILGEASLFFCSSFRALLLSVCSWCAATR